MGPFPKDAIPGLVTSVGCTAIAAVPWQSLDRFDVLPSFPCVIKPRLGSGGRGVVKIEGETEWLACIRALPRPLGDWGVQPFIDATDVRVTLSPSRYAAASLKPGTVDVWLDETDAIPIAVVADLERCCDTLRAEYVGFDIFRMESRFLLHDINLRPDLLIHAHTVPQRDLRR